MKPKTKNERYDYQGWEERHVKILMEVNWKASRIRNSWPWPNPPSKSSIRSKMKILKHYGDDFIYGAGPFGQVDRSKMKTWEEYEISELKRIYIESRGDREAAYIKFKELKITKKERSWSAFETKLSQLMAGGLETYNPHHRPYTSGKYIGETGSKPQTLVDYHKEYEENGYKVLTKGKLWAYSEIEVECSFGHTWKKKARQTQDGCPLCAAAGQMSLTELKDHPLGQQPTYIYAVQFKDTIGKTGITGIKGVKQRGVRYPDYKIDREVLTTLFHARRIEAATHNEANRIPLYEPLKGNGGTECFEEKEYHKALAVIDREIKCLK